MKQRNIKITCTKKRSLNIWALYLVFAYTTLLRRAVLSSPKSAAFWQENKLEKQCKLRVERFQLQNLSRIRLLKNIVENLIPLI